MGKPKTIVFIKNIFILVFFLLVAIFSFAQREKINSLKIVLPALKDSARIDCVNALSKAYVWVKTDSARLLAKQALKEAETLHYFKGIANSCNNLAWITRLLADDYSGMEMYCKKAIALPEKALEKEPLAYSRFLLGCALAAQSKFSSSLIAFTKAGEAYTKLGDQPGLANVYAYIADVELNRGQYGKSLQYSVKWLNLSKKLNNKRYLDIWASLYKNIADYETAVDYYNQAAQYARGTYHFDELAFFTQSIGEIFFLQEKYDSAKHYYDKAVDYNPNNQLDSRRGELYIAFKKYDSALVYLNKALGKAKKANALNQEMWILLRLSKAYKEMKNDTKALQVARQLLQTAQETGARQYIRDGHFLLYKLFVHSGKQDSSLSHLEKYTALKDTIDKDLSAQKLAFYKIRSEKEKDQSRINLLNEEKKLQQQQLNQTAQQKKFLITGIIALGLIGIILFRNLILKRRNEKQRLEYELEMQKFESEKTRSELQQQATELEMQALRAQMNPHFIFNSLNSINRFILKNNRAQASEYLTKFSKLVRLILQNSQAALIPLESELDALKLYLQLEAVRFNHQFEYQIIIDSDLDADILKVPPLIIQPYAENAIWHGLMHKEEKGHLEIELYQKNDLLYCKITDDGIGRNRAAELKSKSASPHKSMGMRITAERIAILQQKKQINTTIQIRDLVLPDGSAGGTEVLLKIPVML